LHGVTERAVDDKEITALLIQLTQRFFAPASRQTNGRNRIPAANGTGGKQDDLAKQGAGVVMLAGRAHQ
jgi:hypothetical protein